MPNRGLKPFPGPGGDAVSYKVRADDLERSVRGEHPDAETPIQF